MDDCAAERSRLEKLLGERGLRDAQALVAKIPDEGLDGAFAAIGRWDDEPGRSPGLLVWSLRDTGLIRYRRPEDRTPVDTVARPRGVTQRTLQAVYGTCMSPDGFTRIEARAVFCEKARYLGLAVDELIDQACGAQWQLTRTHPALRMDGTVEEREQRYAQWVLGGERPA